MCARELRSTSMCFYIYIYQWGIPSQKSGLAERCNATLYNLPLDLTSGSGFATDIHTLTHTYRLVLSKFLLRRIPSDNFPYSEEPLPRKTFTSLKQAIARSLFCHHRRGGSVKIRNEPRRSTTKHNFNHAQRLLHNGILPY